jgi:hypothetical protein
MEFMPFNSALGSDPCHQDCFNSFAGFPLNSYTPTKKVDPQKTLLWQLLVEGWCNSDKETVQYLCSDLAWKVRYPFLKTQRAKYLRSAAQGTGKSTFFKFLENLFGKKSVVFLLDLSRMHCRFNSWQSGALFLCVDDIAGATKAQIEKCKSRITSQRFQYEIKNGKTMTMANFEEYWFTTNATRDIFVEPGDRRGIFLTVNDKFKYQPYALSFFDKVYRELEDQDVMHAFWKMFCDWKLGSFDPKDTTCDPAVCVQEKDDAKLGCAKQSHLFIAAFFTEEEWPTMYRKFQDPAVLWRTNYDIQKLSGPAKKIAPMEGSYPAGTIRILVKHKQLYHLYKAWFKENCPGSNRARNAATFWHEMTELGIRRIDRVEIWNKSKPRQVAAIYLEDVIEGFKNTYGPVPRELDRWVIADDTWKESKRKYITGDGTSYAFIEPMKAGIANLEVNKK